MMNPGLVYLLRKQTAGMLRQMRRRFSGAKGVLALAGLVVFLILIMGPSLGMMLTERPEEAADRTDSLRTWGPPVTLLMLLSMGLSTRALYFKPAEVDFIFPAPISRRQVLLFNVLSRARIQVLSALFCSIFFLRWANLWYAGMTATLFYLVFLQLVSQSSGLFFATVGEALGKKLRRAALILLVLLGLVGFLMVRERVPAVPDLRALLEETARSPVVGTLSWITRPFIELFIADSPASYSFWLLVSVAVLASLIVLMMLSDVAYTEAAMVTSRRVQERLRRMSSGGGAFAALGRGRGRFSLPRFPGLGGAGPLAWRQCVELTRNLRSILMMAVIMILPMVLVSLASGRESSNSAGNPAGSNGELRPDVFLPFFILLFLSLVFSQNVLFDFRRDLDRMSYLKSLPISSGAVAAGQVAAPVLLIASIQVLALGLYATLGGGLPAGWFAAGVFVLLPFNWISTSLDNGLFLLFPYRMTPKDSGNFPFMGRTMMVMFLKMFLLGVSVAFSGLLGFLVWTLFESPLATGLTVAVLLAAICVPLTLLVAHAFRKFDVSKDIPA